MSQQNCATDTESVLLSMLERLKINSSEVKRCQQTPSESQNDGVSGLVVTLGQNNRVEQCVSSTDGATEHEDHTKQWVCSVGSDRHSDVDNQVSAWGPTGSTSNGFRASTPVNGGLGSPNTDSRWRRKQLLPTTGAVDTLSVSPRQEPEKNLTLACKNVPTLDTAGKYPNNDMKSFCTELGGHRDIMDPMPIVPADIGEVKPHSELNFAAFCDTAKGENGSLVPHLKLYHWRAAGTPTRTEHMGQMGRDDLIPTRGLTHGLGFQEINILKHHNVNSSTLAKIPEGNISTAEVSFMVPGEMSISSQHPDRRECLTYDASPFKFLSNYTASHGNLLQNNVASSSGPCNDLSQGWLGGNVSFGSTTEIPEQAAGMNKHVSLLREAENTPPRAAKKKRNWIDKKTKHWSQRIRERWRSKQDSMKKGERGGVGAMGYGVRETQEGKEAVEKTKAQDADQQQVTEVLVKNTPGEEEDTSCQSQLGRYPGRHVRTFSDFQFNLSPINLVEEILTGEEWSHFLSQKEGPMPTGTSQLSKIDRGIWVQKEWTNGGRQEAGCQSIPSEARVHMEEENSSDAGESGCQSYVFCDPKTRGFRSAMPLVMDTVPTVEPEKEVDFSFLKPVDVLDNSGLLSRIRVSRKRERRMPARSIWDQRKRELEELLEGKERSWRFRDPAGPGSEQLLPEAQTSDEKREADVEIIPLYPLRDPHRSLSCLLPSSRHPFDSPNADSFETVIKKRKIRDLPQDTRHVWFAEELVTAIPCGPSYDFDIEDEMGSESSLPQWILALKKKRGERKPRH
ncbi:uncharacterized protein LOC108935896 [Scleropages formosus]|uniref:uncharacterized protein LOC108935896 n=1 Tax=Scleropages formosus TaxID=113540 RepID=UPI0010FA6C24|nr:uncharacterized protein LOC108935896 [Scleropages formosus]